MRRGVLQLLLTIRSFLIRFLVRELIIFERDEGAAHCFTLLVDNQYVKETLNYA